MSFRNPVNLVLFYLIVVLILCIALSGCTTSINKCDDFGMNVEYVDVYTKKVDSEKMQVIKYRCINKKSRL